MCPYNRTIIANKQPFPLAANTHFHRAIKSYYYIPQAIKVNVVFMVDDRFYSETQMNTLLSFTDRRLIK